jgi:acetylserotonin N-methyltransferase
VTYQLPPIDDRAVWDTWLSLHYLPSVTVADELGIFKTLHESPTGAVELAERLRYDRRATIALLRMLAAMGYLKQRLGQYQLTDAGRLYLLKDSPYYWGHMLSKRTNVHDTLKEHLLGRSPSGIPGRRPEQAIREGSPGAWAWGQIEVEQARGVAARMHSHSLPAAIGLARSANFSGVTRLLDAGAGSGCYPIALAQANPSLRATLMELPAMCDVAQEYIKAGSVADRVDTVAVDMFRDPWPEGYDGVFFANVWHDWNFETCAWLAKQTYDILPSGGHVFLHEMLLDDDGDGPLTSVSFSMMMLGAEGQQFTLPELKCLLEEAGFAGIEASNTYGYYSLVSARKP